MVSISQQPLKWQIQTRLFNFFDTTIITFTITMSLKTRLEKHCDRLLSQNQTLTLFISMYQSRIDNDSNL